MNMLLVKNVGLEIILKQRLEVIKTRSGQVQQVLLGTVFYEWQENGGETEGEMTFLRGRERGDEGREGALPKIRTGTRSSPLPSPHMHHANEERMP